MQYDFPELLIEIYRQHGKNKSDLLVSPDRDHNGYYLGYYIRIDKSTDPPRLSPVDILFYRFALAYICIWFISPKVLFARSKKDELMFVAAGLCGGSIYFITENTALGITLASNVSLIICTAPILTAFLSLLFYRQEKIKPNLIYGSVMALIGSSVCGVQW